MIPSQPSPRQQALQKAQQHFTRRQQLHQAPCLVALDDLSRPQLQRLIQAALAAKRQPELAKDSLHGQSLALLFQKTSTRTRCSFEQAGWHLGMQVSYIDWSQSNFTLADLQDEIRVLSRYYQMIVARVNHHETIQTMARYSEVPIINGLCDQRHPCQALTDLVTMQEFFGSDYPLRITYIGDGNNVCRSLTQGAAAMGYYVTVCTPPDYQLSAEFIAPLASQITISHQPDQAVANCDIIYTDTWISMGEESQSQQRLQAFDGWTVDETLLANAPDHTLVMHCLPAHPGYEISANVLRGPRSLVFEQAENRQYAQQAVLLWLSGHLTLPKETA